MNLKLNLLTTFENLDGQPHRNEKGEVVTVQDVIKMSISGELPEDAQGDAQSVIDKRMKNFDIYLKVRNVAEGENEIELTPEEIVHIKGRVGKVFHTLISGPMIRILNGKDPYK